MKRLLSLLLMTVMMVGMSVTALAQDKDSGAGGNGSITIENASRGIVYSVYKIFDAKVNEQGTSVAYTNSKLPENPYFKKDSAGNISATEEAYRAETKELSDGAIEWIKNNGTKVCSVTSDGSRLKFTGLKYGYYYVTSSLRENGGAIMVTSVAKDATIIDKNSKEPQWTPDEGDKAGGKCIVLGDDQVKENDASIGETIHFRLQINTFNYVENKQIKEYVIEDALPAGFGDAQIESVKVEEENLEGFARQEFQGSITIPWAEDKGVTGWQSLYDTGVQLIIDYTAVVKDVAVIDGDGNKNTARFSWNYTTGETGEKAPEDSTTTYTYAVVLQKVDDQGKALSGVEYEVPFPVKKEADGVYVVQAGLVKPSKVTVTANPNGIVVIKGLKKGTYSITETVAPEGYNKLTEPFDVTTEKIGAKKTNVTTYLDTNGNVTQDETATKVVYENNEFAAKVKVVVNKSGSPLPGTGGSGERFFYLCGMLLAFLAVVVLMGRKMRKRSV